eukprot:scaffold30549_cov60-Attheya_sp.AAC.1
MARTIICSSTFDNASSLGNSSSEEIYSSVESKSIDLLQVELSLNKLLFFASPPSRFWLSLKSAYQQK